jgi:hypothetical protein
MYSSSERGSGARHENKAAWGLCLHWKGKVEPGGGLLSELRWDPSIAFEASGSPSRMSLARGNSSTEWTQRQGTGPWE